MIPKISVVTPSFNQAQFLPETLKSLYSQNYPSLEHVVIDGGSSDGSVDIIRAHQDKMAYWVSEPDDGQTDALVKGFARATGDIFCWLNSDDLQEPTTLWDVARHFERNPDHQFIYGDSMWIAADGRIIKTQKEQRFSRFVWIYDYDYIPQPSAFWRKEIFERAGGMDVAFNYAMDGDLWMRMGSLSRPVHVAKTWSRMRFYPGQKNTKFRDRSIAEEERIRSRYVPGFSRSSTRGRRRLAKAVRVATRLASGGYTRREVTMQLKDRLNGTNWEERESALSDAGSDS